MKLKFLGTGTSQGVPPIGCSHPVCLSEDPRDKRLRTSAIITTDSGEKILIDCGPDFRQQMLANQEADVHAVLLTHEHNDHVIGLDDLRPLIFKNGEDMPIYCHGRVAEEVRKRFPYAFATERYPGAPSFKINEIHGDFELFGEQITPIEVIHSSLPILAFRMRDLAYITDASFLREFAKEKLQDLDFLLINCLRKAPAHHAHFVLEDIFKISEELKPKMIYLTHMSHQIGFHKTLCSELPGHIQPAFDGLEINF